MTERLTRDAQRYLSKQYDNVVSNYGDSAEEQRKWRFYEFIKVLENNKKLMLDVLAEGDHLPSTDQFSRLVTNSVYAYQYLFFKYNFPIAFLGSSENHIGGALRQALKQPELRAAFRQRVLDYPTIQRTPRYEAVLQAVKGKAYVCDVGGGAGLGFAGQYSTIGRQERLQTRAGTNLTAADHMADLGLVVTMDPLPPDDAWVYACAAPLGLYDEVDSRQVQRLHEAIAVRDKYPNSFQFSQAHIFDISDERFDEEFAGRFNLVSTMFVRHLTPGYSFDDWAKRVSRMVVRGGCWMDMGEETYQPSDELIYMNMYRKNWRGAMKYMGPVCTMKKTQEGPDSINTGLLENPYKLPRIHYPWTPQHYEQL